MILRTSEKVKQARIRNFEFVIWRMLQPVHIEYRTNLLVMIGDWSCYGIRCGVHGG